MLTFTFSNRDIDVSVLLLNMEFKVMVDFSTLCCVLATRYHVHQLQKYFYNEIFQIYITFNVRGP